MRLVVVTGMSGAGKSTALKMLEDTGFFCVDNLPTKLISEFAQVCIKARPAISSVALGADIRGGKLFDGLMAALSTNDLAALEPETLFLECCDETLLRRYKETRRAHPLARRGSIERAIAAEREQLREIKNKAKYIVDTSQLLTRQLKERLVEIFVSGKPFDNLIVNILSFGYKHGLPTDADLVFDARFIPNPFYIEELKGRTGLDAAVADYVMSWEAAREFLDMIESMLDFLIPHYVSEGKNRLVVAIGCTGGMHRSVTLAEALYKYLRGGGKAAFIEHRDARRFNN